MPPVTIRDVARKAGVGIGTVSRVINSHPSVSDVTRQAVELAIVELNFSPNPSARRLSLGKTLNIAVVTPFFTRPAFVERLRGVVTALAETPYDVVVYNVETTQQRDRYLIELSRRDRCDGLLIMALAPTDVEAKRLQTGVPTVLLDCYHLDFNRVVIDDVAGGYLAAQHLLDLGHRRIGFVSDSPASPFGFVASRYRLQGYQRALREANVVAPPAYHAVTSQHGVPEAREAGLALLDLPAPPTAIFAASDTQAIGVMQAARARGLRVPEDISVIGYDDIDLAEFLHLTTVHQPLFASGVEAVELLLDAMEHPEAPPREIRPDLRLIVRQTTAPLATPAAKAQASSPILASFNTA